MAYWSAHIAPPDAWVWQQECAAQNGEWVRGAERPTCAVQGGRLLVMGEGADHVPEDVRQTHIPEPCISGAGVKIDHPAGSVDFSSRPEAARYRTAITKDYRRGTNWNGHYVVALWGCPADDLGTCVGMAIIDQTDGNIVEYQERLLAVPRLSLQSETLTVQQVEGEKVVRSCDWDDKSE